MIDDEVVSKKIFRRGEAFAEESPKAASADFAAGAGEAVDGALGVFAGGLADGGIDAEPIARGGDFAEGNAGLRHAEGAGVHTEEHNAFFGGGSEAEILLVRGPRVVERIVHVRHGVSKGEGVASGTQVAGGSDDFLGGHFCDTSRAD